ncbi:hypothetical protein Hanom_Chr09g00866641 [Helianthus anomalus]
MYSNTLISVTTFHASKIKPRQHINIVIIPNSLNNRSNTFISIRTLENIRIDKHTITPQLHHHSSIRNRNDPTGSKMHNRQSTQLLNLRHNIIRRTNLFSKIKHLIFIHITQNPNFPHNISHICHCINEHVSLCSNHSSTFSHSHQSITQITTPTDKRNPKVMFVYMIADVSSFKKLIFINVVNTYSFEDLGFNEVTHSGFGHHGDGDRGLDLFDEGWIGHS